MLKSARIILPQRINEPTSYYAGVDLSDRVICRNVIVFERRSRRTLQQQQLSNRMHHRYVLVRVIKTPGVVSVDGQPIQLDVGDALLICPYQFHHFVDLVSDQLRWIMITFEVDRGDSMLTDLSYARLRPDSEADDLWSDIVRIWTSEKGERRAESLSVLDRLLMQLHAKSPSRSYLAGETRFSPENEWIAKIESLIRRSVREGWTLGEVAKRGGISERYLRQRFEKQMGVSLRDYRSNYQFHCAISLMRDASCSLSGVAELCGFNSQSVFTRFIRRMSGMTPRELLKKIREGRYEWTDPDVTATA